MSKLRWLAIFISFSLLGFAQENPEKKFTVKYISDEITLDGELDEYVWSLAEATQITSPCFSTPSMMPTMPFFLGLTRMGCGGKAWFQVEG